MPAYQKTSLYLNFSSLFHQDMVCGKLDPILVTEWLAKHRSRLNVTSSELYRVAQEMSRHLQPAMPVRYWFYRLYLAGEAHLKNRRVFNAWVNNNPLLSPLFGTPFSRISTANVYLGNAYGNKPYAGSPEEISRMQEEINGLVKTANAELGYGGYLETRQFYTPESQGKPLVTLPGGEEYNLHLGLDFWTAAGTPVYAPLEGTVYSIVQHRGLREIGPALVLFHVPEPGLHFYTIYGFLDPKVLKAFRIGQKIRAGRKIGCVGATSKLNPWPPHLHFQVSMDLFGNRSNFNGTANASDRALWEEICPDPALLLR